MYAVEWQLLDRKGKKVKAKGTTYSSSFTAGVPLNQVYKLKVRGCINVSGTYFYGPWYTKVVVPQPQMNDLKVASGTRIKISWKKVAGATKYIVYGSTSPKKGYKKISTLSSKKTSFIATYVNKKRIKRYNNYYFKVQAVKNKTKSLMTNFKGGQIYTRYY